jgi:hypothetical protein
MQDLEGKLAFITGGGLGVALGQAEVFANRPAPSAQPASATSEPATA